MIKGKTNNKLHDVLPNDDVLSQCIHCGLCLAVCPTYDLTKNERSSPRGRIRMIKSVARGEMDITPVFAEEMNFCLDCQACETACPAGVKYGSMVEAARVEVDNSGSVSPVKKLLKRIFLNFFIAKKSNLKIGAKFLYFYQNFGIQKLLHSSGLFKLVFPRLSEIDKLAPKISKHFSSSFIKEISLPLHESTEVNASSRVRASSSLSKATGEGLHAGELGASIKYKTAFLTGCIMDVAFAEINKDTIEVLNACNCEVISPNDQVCCGSLHAHNGDIKTAKELARKNIDAFTKHEFDYLISNSSGCGAFMKEYGHVLKDDPEYSERAQLLSAKVKDITEFLYEQKPELQLKEISEPVTYHDACHLVHTQKIAAQPRNVLSEIPRINLKPLEEATWCCGSAGIYNITRYDDSMKILERKMENIRKSGAKIVAMGNPGCILQIKYGAEKYNVDVEVLHTVSLVRRSLTPPQRAGQPLFQIEGF